MALPTLNNGAIYYETDIANDLESEQEHIPYRPNRRSRRRNVQSKKKSAMRKHGSILGRSRDSFLVKLMEGATIE